MTSRPRTLAERQSKTAPLYCSFCGKAGHEVFHLIEGPTVFICDECVELCVDIIDQRKAAGVTAGSGDLPEPTQGGSL